MAASSMSKAEFCCTQLSSQNAAAGRSWIMLREIKDPLGLMKAQCKRWDLELRTSSALAPPTSLAALTFTLLPWSACFPVLQQQAAVGQHAPLTKRAAGIWPNQKRQTRQPRSGGDSCADSFTPSSRHSAQSVEVGCAPSGWPSRISVTENS